MVKIQIPDSVVNEINVAAKEQTSMELEQEITKVLDSPETQGELGRKFAAVALPDETPVDSTFLIRCLKNEIERRSEKASSTGQEYNPLYFSSAIRRPKVFIARRVGEAKLEYITMAAQLELLFSEVKNIYPEHAYVGPDANDLIVLRCELPEAYVARVPYVKLCHIPIRFFQTDSVVAKKMPPKKGVNAQGEMVMLCRELEPVWTDKMCFEIKQSTITAAYNYMTVKIRKDDHTLKSWFPGVDKDCQPCQTLEDQFVLVGPHFDSNGQVYVKPQNNQQLQVKLNKPLTLGEVVGEIKGA